MVGEGNLLRFLIERIRSDIENEEAARYIEEVQEKSAESLLNSIENNDFPIETLEFVYTCFILKLEKSKGLTSKYLRIAVDCFLRVCQSYRLTPNHYIAHLNLIITKELMQADDMKSVFEIGKLVFKLKNEGINTEIIENALDISYSSLVFDLATSTEKHKIQEALKALIRAKALKINSTGADRAIIESALSWVEDNEDLYRVKSSCGQAFSPDRNYSQIIIGLLEHLNPTEQEFIERLDVLKRQYGKIEVYNEFAEKSSYDTETYLIDSQLNKEVIEFEDLDIDPEAFQTAMSEKEKVCLFKGTLKKSGLGVCVKKISFENKEDIQKANYEINVLAELSEKHDLFLKFFGSFIRGFDVYIVLENIESELSGNLSDLEKLQISKTLIEGLAYMTKKRIYHLNIRPSNIFLTPSKTPKILNFRPILAHLEPDSTEQNNLSFRSPEKKLAFDQHKKSKRLIKYGLLKSEVYSLGLTLFQIATGEEVLKYEDPKTNNELKQKVNSIPLEELKELIKDMIDKDPEKRLTFIELDSLLNSKKLTVIH